MFKSSSLLSLVLLVSASCGNKSDGESSSDDKKTLPAKDTKTKVPEKAVGPDFSKWNQADKAKAWQGSWLSRENGQIQAWTVSGDTLQTWDGEEEKNMSLGFEAPCRALFVEDTKNGKMKYPRVFAAVNGKLRYGAGGYKMGSEALFCDQSGANYIVGADGKCSLWKESFSKGWEQTASECGFKNNADGAEVFFHGDPNSGEWLVEGDAIVPKGSFPTMEVEGDFTAAKAARDAKAAE